MATEIPLRTSDPWFRTTCPLDRPAGGLISVSFDFKWNARDASWYFDVVDDRENQIITGVRLVLGAYLGRTSRHEIFQHGVLVAVDTSNTDDEAGFDDLGARVRLRYYTVQDVLIGRGVLPLALNPSKTFTDG